MKVSLHFLSTLLIVTLNEKEITSSPMTTKDDPEGNEEKMAKVIKIIHRIRKLRPSMTVFPIYHCVFSKYNEIPDDVY